MQHVKQDGFLYDKIQVGDKLLKFDEFDTSDMTAEHVCYVISSRSQCKRKIVFFEYELVVKTLFVFSRSHFYCKEYCLFGLNSVA